MTELKIVFNMPSSCFECSFNCDKYCALKIFLHHDTNNFVHGYEGKRSPNCPLDEKVAIQGYPYV